MFYKYIHNKFFILSMALVMVLPTSSLSAASYEDALQDVQFQLISAIYTGDQNQIMNLFQVLFDLLALGDGSFSNENSDIDVTTVGVDDIERTSAELEGEIEFFGSSDRAWVWFEYGEESDELEFETSREYLDEDDDEDFTAEIDDLDRDERYYFRAVAEDRDTNEFTYGSIRSFRTDDSTSRSRDDEPEIDVERADEIDEDSAELNGSVDMNDFTNGIVFFVWGEDEDAVEDIEDEDEYTDIDEDGDDLQKSRVDSDLDRSRNYSLDVRGLDDDTEIFFTLCVEYEDEDNDEVIDCGDIEEFETDRD